MTRMSFAIRIVPIWFYNTQSLLILYEAVQKLPNCLQTEKIIHLIVFFFIHSAAMHSKKRLNLKIFF